MRKIVKMTGMLSAVCLTALALGGCGEQWRHALLERDSAMTAAKITVRPGMKEIQMPAARMDASALSVIAGQYRQNGSGPLQVVATYDPASPGNGSADAMVELTRIVNSLRKDGVTSLTSSLQQSPGPQSQIYIGYKALVAEGPAGCTGIGGLDGRPTQATSEDEYGCTTANLMARQIANPADLEGRAGLDSGSGRREGNIPAAYQKGTQNPPLQDIQSSTKSTSQ